MAETIVLPGETISSDVLPMPLNPSQPLKLGPGLRHVPPSTITSVIAGSLCTDQKKNAIWVENNSGRVSHPRNLPNMDQKLNYIVQPPTKRPHHRHSPPLLHRFLPLLHYAPHNIRSAPSASFRKCNQED